jgi:hypothetical protein
MAIRRMVTHSGEPDMDRLPFVLPDFTRIAWAGAAARDVWKPRLESISQAFSEIEWQSVVSDVRRCSLISIHPENLVDYAAKLARHGLSVLPLTQERAIKGIYSATSAPAVSGKPYAFRMAVGRIEDLAAFSEAWKQQDDDEIGRLLGYPACCRDFFEQVWKIQKFVDTTWPMAAATVSTDSVSIIEVHTNPYTNMLWRWMGIRAVPHLPCSFKCEEANTLGRSLVRIGRDIEQDEAMDWLVQVLSWPVEWSALHGIAEIKTPILKISTRTDATAEKYTVRYLGRGYPSEGAEGINFPYMRDSQLVQLRQVKARQWQPTAEAESWYYTDNGFASESAMNFAHEPIVQVVREAMDKTHNDIVDLGCGNGVLLKKIISGFNICPYGIDSNPTRIRHARELLPRFAKNFVVGDIHESEKAWGIDKGFSIVLIMPGRLLEIDMNARANLLQFLKNRCQTIIVYAYGDWLQKFDNVDRLAGNVGLSLCSKSKNRAVGIAVVQ